MTKDLYKTIMKRSRLTNNFLRGRTKTNEKNFKLQKHLKGEKVNLIENGKNISNDTELCNIFNGFFSNIISDLNIPKKYHCFPNDLDPDSVLSALKAFESQSSVQNTKSTKFNLTFSFENI